MVKSKKIKEVNMTVKIQDFIKFKKHFAKKVKLKLEKILRALKMQYYFYLLED